MNKIFERIGSLIERKTAKVLLVFVIVLIILIAGASNIKIATGNETLVTSDNKVYISNKQMEEVFGGESIIILFTETVQGELLSGENIQKMWNIEKKFQGEENIFSFISPSSILYLKSSMMSVELPKEQQKIDSIIFDENNQIRPMFSDVVIDDENCIMVIKLKGNLGDEEKDRIGSEVKKALDEEDLTTVNYIISGKPILDLSLREEMRSNMKMMIGLAVLIMFIILSLIFKVRWRILSLGIILVSVIATLGFMGISSVPITMVSMAVFPILIGLGIDYSIQFHNRYEEEKAVAKTMSQIGKAIFIAVFATVLGFISLYASPVPMIKDFGKMLTIGVIISFAGSIFLLMSILHLRNKRNINGRSKIQNNKNERDKKESFLDKIMKSLAKGVVRFSIPILIIALGLSVMGFLVDKEVGVETDIETFMPQDMQALQDIHSIRDVLGSTDQIVIYVKDDNILSEENMKWIQTKTEIIEQKHMDTVIGVKSIDTLVSNFSPNENIGFEQYLKVINTLPKQQLNMFLSDDKKESVLLINIKHLPTEQLQEFIDDLESDLSDGSMEIQITGKSVLDVEMVNGLTKGRVKMTVIGLALVFSALLLIYRNIFKALIPIIPVALIIGMSIGLMYVLKISYTPITATLGALVLGMGTEMTVMILERYLEERNSGKEKIESMLITVSMIGKATLASGLTTIGGFSVLMISQFIILRDFGLMTVLNITLALISTFVVLPPLIFLLDKFIVKKKKIENIL